MRDRARTAMLTSSCLILLALPIAAIGTASCSSSPMSPTATGSGSGSQSTTGSGTGSLRLMLTDAPIDDVEKVNIFFTSVTIKPAGKPVEELALDLAVNPVDLLTLQGTVTELAGGVVPAGDYQFIHINIDASRSTIVVDGVEKPLQIPSGEIKILGNFSVGGSETTVLTLDFDAEKSLLLRGNGQWLMKPVIFVMKGNGDDGDGENDVVDDEEEAGEDAGGRGGRGGRGGGAGL